MTAIDKLRQPEYTGENRCVPCTAVNVVIASIVSTLAAVASTVFGAGVFVLSLATIYFRGYLVPGTPTFTKRYFPNQILQWFDKDNVASMTKESIEIDPERVLLDSYAVEPCREGIDLCLTPTFQRTWRERIHTVREDDPNEESLKNVLDASKRDDQIVVEQRGDAFVAQTDNAVVGQWSSQAAVIADIAAAIELDERISGWQNYSPADMARVLMSLRIFVEQCPECDGPVQVEQEVVESCCRSYDVVASACQDCETRLFEMEWDDTGTDESPTQPNRSTQTSA